MSTHLSSLDPSLPSSLPNSSQSLDHSPNILSKLGQTRCYWGLLDSDLNFLYFDPVLQGLLGPQADLLVGKSLLQFVHPDEQATAKHDLSGVLGNRTLHGSVTRVRFSRLSRVRRELGYQGPLSPWSEAEKKGADSNYMAVDIVINWAAESLVLCFIHAVADAGSDDDINEESKNPWNNWCGTPQMTHEQVQLMYQRLLDRIPRPRDMTRVFQILLNRPDRHLYMSWPQQGTDGQPNSRDFAKLADEVQIGSPAGSDTKTSCTRRYKALQQIYMGSIGNKEVESIFIPHGSIIFACHKVELSRYPHAAPANGNPVGYAGSSYGSQPQPFYENASSSYDISRLSGPAYDYLHQPSASQNMVPHFHPPDQWPQSSSSNTPGHYNQDWANAAVSPTSNVRSVHVPPQNSQHQWPSHPPSYNVDQFSTQSGAQRSMSPYHYSQATGENTGSDGGSGPNEVPPPRSGQRRGTARDQYGNGGRSTGKPPVGVNKCSSCKVTQSPEWRKGPSGKKDLCNACGLRYARSRAKKEGVTSSRRRKDKPFSAKSASAAQQQATQGSSSASVARRATFDESSFLASPATPDGDGYSPQTVKTSPPSSRSAAGFVHYGQSHSSIDTRAPQYNYSVPSSVSESTTIQQPSPHVNGVPLPRLTTGSFSTTSSANSPMSSTHASSFERDSAGLSTRPRDRLKREREQVGSPIHLPPTPMSASSDWSRKSASFI